MEDIRVKTRKELEEIVLKKQDFIIDKHVNIYIEDEKKEDNPYFNIHLDDYLRETPHVLEKLKTKNIEEFLRSEYSDLEFGNTDEGKIKIQSTIDRCLEILKEREASGELIGRKSIGYPEEIQKPMIEKIGKRYYEVIKNEPKIEEIMSNSQGVSVHTAFSLIQKFNNGGFTQKELELVEKMSESNPQMNLDFACIDNELIEILGITNMYDICNNSELANKLINIKDNNKELLHYMAGAISLYDNAPIGERLNAIESIINFAEKNAFNSEIDYNDMKSVRDFVNYSYFNHSIFSNGQYESGGFRNNINKSCDEEYKKLKEEIYNRREKEKNNENSVIYKYIVEQKNENINDIKDIIFKKNFSMDYSDAKRFIEKYGAELEFVKEKSKDNLEYNCLKAMIDINKIEDLDELLELYNKLDYNVDPIDIAHIDNNLNLMYSKTFEEKMKETTDKINDIINSGKAKVMNIEGKEVKMVELDGDFSFLVHSSNTGYSALGANYEKKIYNDSYKYTWNYSPDRASHVMSTSYVDQDFMGMAPVSKGGILYGFTTLKNKDIVTKGPTDINTFVNSFGYGAAKQKNYTAENITKQTRRVYPEVGIEKNGLKPDFVIVCDDFDEDLVEDSLKCAAEWDIPVVYLDKQKILNQQMQRLDNKLEIYSKEPSIDKLKDIVNSFETNKAGWLLNRKEGVDESMTARIDNSRFAPVISEMELKIGELVKSEMCKMNVEQRAEMIGFFKEEKEKYDFSKEISEKKISATEMSKYIRDELNDYEEKTPKEERNNKENIEDILI